MSERVYIFFRGWITAALFVAVGCAPTVQGEQKPQSPLTGEEIKQRVLGNSVSGTTRDGPYTVYFPDYGEVLGVRSFNYKDRGTWQVKGDMMCIHWDNWWGNVERCWDIFLKGRKITWIQPNGGSSDSAKLVNGNPAGL